MSMPDKPVTVRLRQAQLRELMGLAVLDGGSLADLMRDAVDQYLERRLADPQLPDKVREARERQADLLDALIRH